MSSLAKRVAALLCMLAFVQGAVVQCAGWEPTARARRQCCTEGACARRHSAGGTAKGAVAQADADACCLESAQQSAAATASALHAASAVPFTSAIAHPAGPLGTLPPNSAAPTSRTPLPPSRVPRYLLISILLV